ncbi:hypothetical protein FIBSPDRAFT_746094, partial [Athelia psychrophila]
WRTAISILPQSQAGFREGFRTNNHPLVLRCAVNKAIFLARFLYICFVNFTNASPSTHPVKLCVRRHY